jgi:plasmid stabilization system protein ParE
LSRKAAGGTLALEYAEAADEDLDGIADYYELQGAWQAALDVPERIQQAARLICHAPHGWAIGASGVHERVLSDLPFRIVYLVTATHVRVLRIKHTLQQWP